jgi:hypothetical protein
MKQLMLLPLLCIGTAAQTNHLPSNHFLNSALPEQSFPINSPTEEASSKMQAAVFKAQGFCRVELKDFEFDAAFKIVSVTVYFSGAGFKNVERGTLNSTSLQPIKPLMNRCTPGSVVIFDEVKVLGPDNLLRTIRGLSLLLT